MKYIPNWIIDALLSKNFKCHECQKIFIVKDLRALGIRESYMDAKKEFFFIELKCKACGKATSFEMQEMDIIQLSEEVVAESEDLGEDIYEDMEDIEEMDGAVERAIEKAMDEKREKGLNDLVIPHNDSFKKKQKFSKITLKDVRETAKALKPKDFKHESLLEMMGMSPEEIIEYRESE
jgi:transcription elongation factor Elf1